MNSGAGCDDAITVTIAASEGRQGEEKTQQFAVVALLGQQGTEGTAPHRSACKRADSVGSMCTALENVTAPTLTAKLVLRQFPRQVMASEHVLAFLRSGLLVVVCGMMRDDEAAYKVGARLTACEGAAGEAGHCTTTVHTPPITFGALGPKWPLGKQIVC